MVVYTQEYETPLDIMNRSMQIIGEPLISDLDEDSKGCTQAKFAYDKVRKAELQRNLWTFATRRVAIRAIDTMTKLFVPIVFDPAASAYASGSLVTYDDEIWINRFAIDEPGITPGSDNRWEFYFGPLTALPVSVIGDPTVFYSGELVWQTVTMVNSIALSRIDGNSSSISDPTAWVSQEALEFQDPALLYPLGTGPSNASSSRNVYMLPNGFLRLAPQDPKAGANSYLGAPSGMGYNDWEIDDTYLITRDLDPILLRFVANMRDVTKFDAMFCEGLASRLAMALAEPLTQSTEKFKMAAALYKNLMGEARLVNSIEAGAVEPAEDDYVTCRY